MFRNFFLTALRNLSRNKTFTILNVGGLVLGVGCSIVLFSIIKYETSFNESYENFDNVFRVTLEYDNEGEQGVIGTIPHPLMKSLRSNIVGVDHMSQFYRMGEVQLSIREGDKIKNFIQEDIGFTDEHFFEILDFQWLAGAGNLDEPKTIVISRSTAKKLFNITEDFRSLLGETISVDNEHNLTIKGVFEDITPQSDFRFSVFIDYESQEGVNDYFGEGKIWARLNGGTMGFILTEKGTDPYPVEQQMKITYEDSRASHLEFTTLNLQPMSDFHYNTDIGSINARAFPIEGAWTLAIIGILLIVASSINFINLSTAKATNRAKEVGVRKVLGSSRRQLVLQHLSETFILVLVSIIIGLALAELMFKVVSPMIGLELSLVDIPRNWLILVTTALLMGITILTGLYPAGIVSRFSPVEALKSSIGSIKSKGSLSLRRLLVIAQFVISQALLIGTLAAVMQNNFLRGQDLGFRQNGIISIELPEVDQLKTERFRNELRSFKEVEAVSAHLGSPMARTNNTGDLTFLDAEGVETEFNTNFKEIDESYLELFGLNLLAGKNVSKSDPKRSILINETTSKKMGFNNPADAIGKTLEASWGGVFKIQGVVSDFNMNSLRSEIGNLALLYGESSFYEVAVSLKSTSTSDISNVLKNLDETWMNIYPEYVLKYDFLDQQILNNYEGEQRMSKLFQLFAGIAILIGCLGLYGLIDFMAIKKMKEIGIRKVLGASILNILDLFIRELLILMTISVLVAVPIMYFVLDEWLSSYVYRIDLGVGLFITSFLVIILIAVLTMGYRSIKASNLNPVLTLKDE